MATWTSLREHSLTRESLEALLNNKIPAIRIKGFATTEECTAFTQSAKQGNIKYYNVAKRIGYIGMAQYEYRWDRPKSDYFDAVKLANADLAEVTARAFDPVQRLIDTLSAVYPHKVGAAEEPGMGRYFAGIIRLASEGVDLHADFAPFNTPDYSIRDIDAQLGWNFSPSNRNSAASRPCTTHRGHQSSSKVRFRRVTDSRMTLWLVHRLSSTPPPLAM